MEPEEDTDCRNELMLKNNTILLICDLDYGILIERAALGVLGGLC